MTETDLPQKVKKRIELAKLFYPLDRKYQRRWAKLLIAGFGSTAEQLYTLSAEYNYNFISPEDNTVLWLDGETDKPECMFCLINDSANLELTASIFERIKKYAPVFTYAFVNQKKDGDGVFDIFRFSKFSYLEHCNRVKYP